MPLRHCRCHRQIQERSGTCMATTCQIVPGRLGARSLAFWLLLALIPLFFLSGSSWGLAAVRRGFWKCVSPPSSTVLAPHIPFPFLQGLPGIQECLSCCGGPWAFLLGSHAGHPLSLSCRAQYLIPGWPLTRVAPALYSSAMVTEMLPLPTSSSPLYPSWLSSVREWPDCIFPSF